MSPLECSARPHRSLLRIRAWFHSACVNRLSIVWLAARRQGIPRCAAVHRWRFLTVLASPAASFYGFTVERFQVARYSGLDTVAVPKCRKCLGVNTTPRPSPLADLNITSSIPCALVLMRLLSEKVVHFSDNTSSISSRHPSGLIWCFLAKKIVALVIAHHHFNRFPARANRCVLEMVRCWSLLTPASFANCGQLATAAVT